MWASVSLFWVGKSIGSEYLCRTGWGGARLGGGGLRPVHWGLR